MFDFMLVAKTLAILFFGVISPGPDFFMVLRNSLSFGRRAGIVSALGIGIGCLVSFAILMCGLNFLFSYPLIRLGLTLLCGGYLMYLGWCSIRQKVQSNKPNYQQKNVTKPMRIYFKHGFFTNILNPKLYAVSGAILAYTEQQNPGIMTNVAILLGNAIMVFAWFAFVAIMLSYTRIQSLYFRREQIINYLLGATLIFVGIRLLFSS